MSEQEITKELTFITSTFLAGADQNKPEIRAPSIRGALRWWFRVLAGDRDVREEEKLLFGGVHGESAVASAIAVRVEDANIVNNQRTLPLRDNTEMGYIGYFARVSGKKEGIQRTEALHYIGAGSTFTLTIRAVRPVPTHLWSLLEEAVQAFVWVGALGLRATRGFGRLAEPSALPTAQAFRDWARTLRSRKIFLYEGKMVSGTAQAFLADQLKELRRKKNLHPSNSNAHALGASSPRQASALHLCPVQTADEGILPFFLYTDNACSAKSLKTDIDAFCLESHCFTAL